MVGKTLISPDTVVLVSGGARGITAQCVIKLAHHTPCKFILMGRTSVNEPLQDWALDCPDDAELKRRAMTRLTADNKKATPQAVARYAPSKKSKPPSWRYARPGQLWNI